MHVSQARQKLARLIASTRLPPAGPTAVDRNMAASGFFTLFRQGIFLPARACCLPAPCSR